MEKDIIAITNNDTRKHILNVNMFINMFVVELLKRGIEHDNTKLKEPEVDVFAEFTPKLSTSTYGSDEYKTFTQQMKPALDHHYAKNRHHPEHFARGIKDMNLVDLIEMFCDWKAATLRHNNGNLETSIEKNQTRFNMSEDLISIFKNTIAIIDKQGN